MLPKIAVLPTAIIPCSLNPVKCNKGIPGFMLILERAFRTSEILQATGI